MNSAAPSKYLKEGTRTFGQAANIAAPAPTQQVLRNEYSNVRPLRVAVGQKLDGSKSSRSLSAATELDADVSTRVPSSTLLTPNEVRARLPGSVPLSSEELDWPGLTVHIVHQLPGELVLPPLADNLVILRLSGSNQLRRWITGERPTHSRVKPGMINVTPARRASRCQWTGYTKSLQLFLRDELFSRVALQAFDLDPADTALEPQLCIRDSFLEQTGYLLLKELERPGPASKLLVESLANALAVHLLRNYASSVKSELCPKGGLASASLRRVIDYIEAHLVDAISLEQMAQLAGYSAYHFSRLFKQATRRSPHQYLIERRVQRATELLKAPRVSTAEIAYALGFSSQSHFATAFKRVVGVTPKAYQGSC
jgi:AraC family transcriptional regulator